MQIRHLGSRKLHLQSCRNWKRCWAGEWETFMSLFVLLMWTLRREKEERVRTRVRRAPQDSLEESYISPQPFMKVFEQHILISFNRDLSIKPSSLGTNIFFLVQFHWSVATKMRTYLLENVPPPISGIPVSCCVQGSDSQENQQAL